MKKVSFLTGHYYNSQRKAGFHFLAKALKEKGFQVVFISSIISALTFLRKEHIIYEKYFQKNIFKPIMFEDVKSIINFSLLRPPISRGSKVFEFLSKGLFKLSHTSIKEIQSSEYVIFESVMSILFFDKVKSINPTAKLVYRVSDDMEAMNVSELILSYERSILHRFDLVSVPTKVMYDKFSKLSLSNTRLHFHGIEKSLYDNAIPSPYTHEINHVFVGNAYLDQGYIDIASKLFPEHYFHIIGNFEKVVHRSNVIYYGYMNFEDTIPYVKFASIGLHILKSDIVNVDMFADSLKVLQYSYCKLPIIAPSVIPAHHRENFFYYEYNDENSIKECIEKALIFDKNSFAINVKGWDELAMELINE